jgi:hypothetical protein
MTDSTTNTGPGDGGFDGGSSVARLEAGAGSGAGDVEDRTAADVFDRIRTDFGDEDGADDVLGDESPADIIASTAESDPERDAGADDDLLVDEDELAELLTGRTKEDGFLWIDPQGDDPEADGHDADAMPDWEFDDAESEGAESGTVREREDGSPTDDGEPSDPVDGDAVGTEPAGDADGRDGTGPEQDDSAVGTPEKDADPGTDDGTEREAADESSGALARLRSAFGGLF